MGLVVAGSGPAAGAIVGATGTPERDNGVQLADRVLASTTTEWTASFARHGRRYVPPRPIYLDQPRRHPARGFGHSPRIGLIIDLGEMRDIAAIFGSDAPALTALIIAHEVAHHVQAQSVAYRARPTLAGPARELAADCAAGWWLGRANAREALAARPPLFAVPDIARQLPRLFAALDTINNGRITATDAELSVGHGLIAERVAAFRRGLAGVSPAVCGVGFTS